MSHWLSEGATDEEMRMLGAEDAIREEAEEWAGRRPGLPKPYYEEPGIQIFLGDCRDILPLLPKVDLILTDPPYGINLSTDFAERFKSHAGKWWNIDDRNGIRTHTQILGDDKPFDPSSLLTLKAEARVFWGANCYASRLPDNGGWWVWDKRGGSRDVTDADWPMSEAELAWTDIGKGVRVFRHTWFGLIRDSERSDFLHPAQKPVALMRWCIRRSRTRGRILDPYMGSGTTLVAAKQLGRRAIGIEIEEKYCAIAVERLRQAVLPLEPAAPEPEQLPLEATEPAPTPPGDGSGKHPAQGGTEGGER